MKDILVEFTDNGAIIHKDPSVIASKKDLPYCFLILTYLKYRA
jgi:hypothetical protein